MELRIANCCGACKYVNRPKKPEDHAAHYTVAKTERWCYKYGIPVTRETVCDEFELETKRGAYSAFKRILAFNKKLEKIIEVKKWMKENNIEKITHRDYDFSVINDKLCYRWNDWKDSKWYILSCKESEAYKKLIKAYENNKNIVKN